MLKRSTRLGKEDENYPFLKLLEAQAGAYDSLERRILAGAPDAVENFAQFLGARFAADVESASSRRKRRREAEEEEEEEEEKAETPKVVVSTYDSTLSMLSTQ